MAQVQNDTEIEDIVDSIENGVAESVETAEEQPSPRKLANKYTSVEDLEAAYLNAQEELGRKNQELGDYRSKASIPQVEEEQPEFQTDVEQILWEKSQKLEQAIGFLHQSAAQREVEDAFERLEGKIGQELDPDMRKKISDIGGKMTGMTTRQAVDYAYRILSFDGATTRAKDNPAAGTPRERLTSMSRLGVNSPTQSESEGNVTITRDDSDMLAQLGIKDTSVRKRIAERATKRREEK